MNIDDFGIKVTATVAGALGTAVALIVERPQIGPLGYFSALVVGLACANYLPDIFVTIFDIPQLSLSLAFVSGLIGMHIVAGLIKISAKFQANPVQLLANIFGRRRNRKENQK